MTPAPPKDLSHTPQNQLRTILRSRLQLLHATLTHQLHAVRVIQASISEAYPNFPEDITALLTTADQAAQLAGRITTELDVLDKTRAMFDGH